MALQVLVIASDPSVPAVLARVFREARAELLSAATVEDASAILAALKVDLMVVDGGLPGELSGCVLEIARVLQPEARCFLLVDELDAPSAAHPTRVSRVWFDELCAA